MLSVLSVRLSVGRYPVQVAPSNREYGTSCSGPVWREGLGYILSRSCLGDGRGYGHSVWTIPPLNRPDPVEGGD